ncbi:hypothetical protein TcasGA2_TC002419 [Tribolium castaneum]|uniref:Secreted protein n=1 Tax=Tribolium castaneum TaxID=7070 RepID=D6WII3_TRICA|nr:hypothetical protein TcasGA2_TC002419 [Tribolium castaneum]
MVVCSVLPLSCAAVLFCAAAAAANCPALVLGSREDTPAHAATLTKSRHHSAPLMAQHRHRAQKKKKKRTHARKNPGKFAPRQESKSGLDSGLAGSWCATDRRRAPDFHSEFGFVEQVPWHQLDGGSASCLALLQRSFKIHSSKRSILGHSCVTDGTRATERDGKAPHTFKYVFQFQDKHTNFFRIIRTIF